MCLLMWCTLMNTRVYGLHAYAPDFYLLLLILRHAYIHNIHILHYLLVLNENIYQFKLKTNKEKKKTQTSIWKHINLLPRVYSFCFSFTLSYAVVALCDQSMEILSHNRCRKVKKKTNTDTHTLESGLTYVYRKFMRLFWKTRFNLGALYILCFSST